MRWDGQKSVIFRLQKKGAFRREYGLQIVQHPSALDDMPCQDMVFVSKFSQLQTRSVSVIGRPCWWHHCENPTLLQHLSIALKLNRSPSPTNFQRMSLGRQDNTKVGRKSALRPTSRNGSVINDDACTYLSSSEKDTNWSRACW